MGFNAVFYGDSPTFRRNIFSPSLGSMSNPRIKPGEVGGKLSSAYSTTLKIEAICSSETSDSLRTSRRYESEDRKKGKAIPVTGREGL
jgi:hypothetical protein